MVITNLPYFFDRFTFAFSLAVHIIIASVSIALPLIILIAEIISIRNKDKYYAVLAKRMTLALIVLFAIGTASGTVVAIELLFLWPKFMSVVGQVAILPVFIEVFAFFTEAIALVVYFYFDNKFKNRYAHAAVMGVAAIGAAMSGALITMLNAFMNTPVGFNIQQYLANGTITDIQPFAIFNAPATWMEIMHVLSSSYFAGTFIFIAFFAWQLHNSDSDKQKKYHTKAIELAFIIGVFATFFTIYSGINSIATLYHIQPEKYAALEGNMFNHSYAAENIFGIPVNNAIVGGLNIPNLQSFLATGTANGTVPGLNQFPMADWPPLFVHDLFDLMFFGGFGMAILMFIVVVLVLLEHKPLDNKWVRGLLVLMGIGAVFLLEDGWVMAEIARQPWIIYNVMLVSQAYNNSTSIIPIAFLFIAFYALAIPFTIYLINLLLKRDNLEDDLKEV